MSQYAVIGRYIFQYDGPRAANFPICCPRAAYFPLCCPDPMKYAALLLLSNIGPPMLYWLSVHRDRREKPLFLARWPSNYLHLWSALPPCTTDRATHCSSVMSHVFLALQTRVTGRPVLFLAAPALERGRRCAAAASHRLGLRWRRQGKGSHSCHQGRYLDLRETRARMRTHAKENMHGPLRPQSGFDSQNPM